MLSLALLLLLAGDPGRDAVPAAEGPHGGKMAALDRTTRVEGLIAGRELSIWIHRAPRAPARAVSAVSVAVERGGERRTLRLVPRAGGFFVLDEWMLSIPIELEVSVSFKDARGRPGVRPASVRVFWGVLDRREINDVAL